MTCPSLRYDSTSADWMLSRTEVHTVNALIKPRATMSAAAFVGAGFESAGAHVLRYRKSKGC